MRIGGGARDGGWEYGVVVAGVGVALGLGLVALLLMGGQTSTILSTVGSAVTSPGEGVPDAQDGADSIGSAVGDDGASGSGATPIDRAITTTMDVARPDLLVIRTGELELRVTDIAAAIGAATRAVEAAGGYVSTSEQTGAGEQRTASVTYRIPVTAWGRVEGSLRGIATDVVRAEVHTEDVTASAVDLEARIRNLRTTEAALQAIMTSARSVKDVLAVQAELTTIRGQIEEAVARLGHLQDQAAFSTITVRFALPPVAATKVAQRGFDPQAEVDRSVAQLMRLGQRALSFGIWFSIVGLPIALALAVMLAVAYGAWRLVLNRRSGHAA